MSLFPIKIPSMGESISQAVVSKMLKKAGDIVGFQEEILELETDKVNQVICSPSAGKLHWQVHEGDTVTIGQIVAQIDPEACQTLDAKSPGSESTQKILPESILENKPKKEKNLSKKKTSTFEEINQHPDTLQSHIMSIDSSQVNQPLDAETEEKSGLVPLENDPAIVPSTFKRASAFSSSEPREKRSKLSLLKRTMANRLLQSQATTATLTTFNEIDMSEVMKCREQYKEEFLKRHGVKLSLMSFFTKAVVQALEKVPAVGARIEGEDWVQPFTYDIGVAVSTDRGLLVPILRSCEQLSLAEIEQALFDVVSRARESKVTLQELTDGCFTISNAGVFGSLLSTPILNPPQSAILGMHKIEKRAVVIEGDQLAVRPMMYVALSYDHRVIDGKQAVSFLLDIKESIEEPERMLLDI